MRGSSAQKSAQIKWGMLCVAVLAVVVFCALAIAVMFVIQNKVENIADAQHNLRKEINSADNNNNNLIKKNKLNLRDSVIAQSTINDYWAINTHQEDDLIQSTLLNGYRCNKAPPVQPIPNPGFFTHTFRQLTRKWDRTFAQLGIPGMAIGIVWDQQVLFQRGWGEQSTTSHVVVNTDTLFRIGSLTRLFTSILAFKERDMGNLKFEQELKDLVPNLNIKSQYNNKRYTIKSVLADLSGLPLNLPPQCSLANCNYTTAQIVDYINNSTLQAVRPPFWVPSKSNLAYALLGRGLEGLDTAGGSSYEELVQNYILNRLNMTSTSFSPNASDEARMASGYEFGASIPMFDPMWARPWGGLWTSIDDMTQFMRALNLVEALRDSSLDELVLPQTMRELMLPIFMNPDSKTGQASPFQVSYIYDRVVRGLDGVIKGYGAHLLLVPGLRLAIVALGNKGEMDMSQFTVPAAVALIPLIQNQLELMAPAPVAPNDTSLYLGNFQGLNVQGRPELLVVSADSSGVLTVSSSLLPSGVYYQLDYIGASGALNASDTQDIIQSFKVATMATAGETNAEDSLTCASLFNSGIDGDIVTFSQPDPTTGRYTSIVLQEQRYAPFLKK